MRRALPCALLMGAALFGSCAAPRPSVPPVELGGANGAGGDGLMGRPVPVFSCCTIEGQRVRPEQARGKLLLVQLWGVNCSSCLVEMAFLEELYREFRDRGLVVWGVNAEQLGPEAIRRGLERKGVSVSYPVLVDPDLAVTGLFTELFIPVLTMVDAGGTVRYHKVGFNPADREAVRRKVEQLLP